MSSSPYTRKSTRAAVFYAILLRVPAQIATLVGYVVLVRYLSELEFGVYSLFYAMLPLSGTLISFGMENTLKRYQPEYLRNGENRLAYYLSRRIGLLRLLTTSAFLLLIFAFWDDIAPFFKIQSYREHFLLFALLIVTHFQCQILTISLSAHLLHKFSVGITAAFSILKVCGYLLTIVVFEFDLWMAIAVDCVAYLLFFLALKYAYVYQADHARGEQTSLPRDETKRLVRYAAYYSFNDAGTLALDNRKDNFFIAAFMDPISVGAYAMALRFNEMLGRVSPTRVLESVIQPLFVSLDYKSDPQRIHRYFSFLMTVAYAVRVPLMVFVAAYHREIIVVLFGGRFLDYSYLLAIVGVFALGQALSVPVTLVAQMEEKAQFILISKIFGAFGIVASLLLIPVIGVLGAVVANGTAILFKNLFIWWFVRHLARWTNFVSFLSRTTLIWAAFGVLVVLQKEWLNLGPLLLLLTGFVVWSGFFLLQIRSVFDSPAKEIVGGLFSGPERKLLRLLGVV